MHEQNRVCKSLCGKKRKTGKKTGVGSPFLRILCAIRRITGRGRLMQIPRKSKTCADAMVRVNFFIHHAPFA
jgi:hypothetical protein